MLDKKIKKLHTYLFLVLAVVLLAAAVIGPLDTIKKTNTFGGNENTQGITPSETVDESFDAGIYFLAQGTHLQTIDVYLTEIIGGQQLIFQLFHQVDGMPLLAAQETVYLTDVTVPGFLSIPVDVDMVPGDEYIYIVRGSESSFHVGLVGMEDVLTAEGALQQEIGFHNDSTIDGVTVLTRATYRESLPGSQKFMMIAIVALIGALIAAAGILFFRRFPEKNTAPTLLRTMQCVLTPLIIVCGGALILAIYPGKLFDSRWRDVVMYESGAILAVGISLYGLWHKREGVPKDDSFANFAKEWNHYGIIAAIAAMLGFASYYMDATYELMHEQGERGIMICLAMIVLLMFSRGERKEETKGGVSLSLMCSLAVFLAMLFIFRNGRFWVVKLLIVWAIFFVRYYFWNEKGLWLRDLCAGISLNFAVTVIWSMTRRYYLAYDLSRFSMQFFTVTVTSYYLLIVAAASLTLLVLKAQRVQDKPLHVKLAFLWKELTLFGFVCAYMMMSITRSGIFALTIMVIIAVVVGARLSASHALKMLAAMIAAVMLVFPVAFTGQRVISPMVGNPVIFEDAEVYPDVLLRNVKWNSTRFMNVEIFLRDFADRIFGGEIGTKWYMENGFYEKQGYLTASAEDISVKETTEKNSHVGALLLTSETEITEEVTDWEEGDYSNGRMVVWRKYLSELNMTGHDIMGVTLESGEVTAHAHNVILQMAYDCGIATGVVFGIYLLLTLLHSWLYYKRYADKSSGVQHRWSLMPFLTVGGFWITGLVEWIFQLCNPYTLILMMVMAPLLFDRSKNK